MDRVYPEIYVQADTAPNQTKTLSKLAYLTLLPPFIFAWAWATEGLISPPVTIPAVIGAFIAFLGCAAIAAGYRGLKRKGEDVPVIRKIFPHPIFTGICLITGGGAIFFKSSTALWMITPMVCLGFAAITLGQLSGGPTTPYIIPMPGEAAPRGRSRIFAYTCLLLPWMVLYEAVIFIGAPPDVFLTHFAFEESLSVVEWTELIYASPYVLVCLVPLLAKTRNQLRIFSRNGLLTMAVVFPFYLLVPLVSPHRMFTAETAMGKLLKAERLLDGAGAAFPSYHVLWALIAAEALIAIYPAWTWVLRAWPVMVAISCVTTGSHGILDVLVSFATYEAVKRIPASWYAQKPLNIIWSAAILAAVLRLSVIGADLRLVVGIGLMTAAAGLVANKHWRSGSVLALAGIAATIIKV